MGEAVRIDPPGGPHDERPRARRNLQIEFAQRFAHGDEPAHRDDGLPRRLVCRDHRDGFDVCCEIVVVDTDHGPELAIDNLWVADSRPANDEPPRSVPPDLLAKLPLVRYLDEAARALPYHTAEPRLDEDGRVRGVSYPPSQQRAAAVAERFGDKIERAARLYRDHDGANPVRAIADAEGVPYDTARSRVKAARRRGLLPAGRPGRPSTRKDER